MSGHVTALRYISFLSISAIVFLTLVVAAKTPAHWRDAVELDQLDTVKYSLWTVRGPSCGTKFDWKDGWTWDIHGIYMGYIPIYPPRNGEWMGDMINNDERRDFFWCLAFGQTQSQMIFFTMLVNVTGKKKMPRWDTSNVKKLRAWIGFNYSSWVYCRHTVSLYHVYSCITLFLGWLRLTGPGMLGMDLLFVSSNVRWLHVLRVT